MQRINPAWQTWNDLQNEGGGGYNPHPKFISAPAARVAPKAANRMLRDQRGNLIPESMLRASLAKDEARLATITNAVAREITQAAIAHARQQLG